MGNPTIILVSADWLPSCPALLFDSRMKVSVVIPTLNEGPRIAELIAATGALSPHEIVVVDGGSEDDTVANASAADVVVECDRGRSVQQNAGAARCSGDVILFLHADCQLTDGFVQAIADCLTNDDCVGGCFRQKIDNAGKRFRAVEWGNSMRVRLLGWGYGDQGIFVRRGVFEQIGGFPDVTFMEDLLLAKRLGKAGKFVLLQHDIHASCRRWQRTGVIRQTLQNWFFVSLAHCGVSPNWLARFYPHVR